ncbi:hypothetical protein V5O48_002397 [Marasmius crinis-equi]|uniref:BTB domain-containing protein n=1 Tax=Marasmius crinis-equi TaxID=585013 RepID=A0ABR3FVU1_9AGAR
MSDYGSSRFRLDKSEKYILPGGDLHLVAGDTLYKVHRYFFERESAKFKEVLGRAAPAGQPKPGSTPGSAILLEVSSEELDKFLWVFYNPDYSWDAPVEDWACILDLACQWRFPQIKAFALRELERRSMSLIDRIVLYQKCSLDEEYLVPLYSELCARDAPLSIAESEKLGVQTAVIVFQARESLRALPTERGKSPLPEDVEEDEIVDTIRGILKGVPQSNQTLLTNPEQAAAYEEALASMDAHARTRKARRVTKESVQFPVDRGAMDTITERETEATISPRISESDPRETEQEEMEDNAGQSEAKEAVSPEEPAEEFRDFEKLDTRSCENLLKNQGASAVAKRESRVDRASRRVGSWTSSVYSTPPVPGAWPRSSSNLLVDPPTGST